MSAHDHLFGAAAAMLEGRLDDPFALLGPHKGEGGTLIRSFQPGA